MTDDKNVMGGNVIINQLELNTFKLVNLYSSALRRGLYLIVKIISSTIMVSLAC